MAAAHTAFVSEESEGTVVRFGGKGLLPIGPVLVDQDATSGVVTLSPVAIETASRWDQIFEAFDAIPRDEKWAEFSRIMDERPMNQPPVDRILSTDKD